MGYEVEVKYRVPDHARVEQRLEALGAASGPAIAQSDLYLAHPARDFARTDEALRVRQVGPETRITYKGPKQGGPTKTREEIEIPLAPGPDARSRVTVLFERLGFRPVAEIRKSRRTYHMTFAGRTLEVALDLAEGLGAFAEVEALAADDADLPATQEAVLGLGRELGLSEVEPRSYVRMTLEQRPAPPAVGN